MLKPKKKWIILDTQPVMRQKSSLLTFPLTKDDLTNIEKMQTYIDASYNGEDKKYHIRPGIGISACQIGWGKQVIYMHLTSDGVERQLLIANPEIVSYSKQVAYLSSGEGCLSTLKVHDGIVPRKSKIVVEAIDLLADINGQKKITIEADGLFGICLQHEIDHLSGIMFYDHINKTNPWHTQDDWKSIVR